FSHFVQSRYVREARFIFKFLISSDDARDMFIGQKTLCAFAGDFSNGVDEKDLAAPRFGFGAATNHDTRFHRRVVEEVRPQTKYTFDEIGFNQFAPHFSFFLPKEYSMRKENGAASAFWLQALQNMLPEHIIG